MDWSGKKPMPIESSAEKGERAAGVADCSAADPQPSSNAQPPLERRLLHDFSFPTLNLRWGGQRILPCVKIPDGATTSEDGEDGVHRSPQMRSSKGGDARGTEAEKASPSFVTTVPAPEEGAIPWNLRKKRAIIGNVSAEERIANECPATAARKRLNQSGKSERKKFSISLSRAEIDEDFFAMTGKKASARPKKRAKAVQRQLDNVFPGLALSEITPSMYRVKESVVQTCIISLYALFLEVMEEYGNVQA